MRFWRRRSIIWTVFSTFAGILALVILLAILKSLSFSQSPVIGGLIDLLQGDIYLFVVIVLVLMTGEIFDRFTFPFNLPAPLFQALGSVFLVIFIFDLFRFLDGITGARIYANVEILRILLSILIFLIVFTGGYFKIFGNLLQMGRQREVAAGAPGAPGAPPGVKTWNDIGNEFRQLVFDVIQRMRDEIRER